jgi:phosphoribosylformimino-5-aminoimidazole carboxamide ribonucleotide (ProFAR) isomerase
MRVGATILLFDGFCYQSYNWNRIRPLGELQGVIDSLEKYQCDEIAILRPIRDIDTAESLQKDIEIVKNIDSITPMSFGGNLRTINSIQLLHNLPIERLVFSSAFLSKKEEVIEYSQQLFGRQSIQALLPFKIERNVEIFSSEENRYISIRNIDFNFIKKYANETILVDTRNDGVVGKFEEDIYKYIPIEKSKLIISGGIGLDNIKRAQEIGLASALIDNRVLHKEYSIKDYKQNV